MDRERVPGHGHDHSLHGATGTYAIPPPPPSGAIAEMSPSRKLSEPPQAGHRSINDMVKATTSKTVRAPYKSIKTETSTSMGSHYSPKYGR